MSADLREGEERKGFIGVDLDGTLAEYHGWQGATHIGKPIPKMVERVKKWLSEGKRVKIFTARVAMNNPDRLKCRVAIALWTREVFGTELQSTAEKDMMMYEFWDDRCVEVITNTGELL